jgi:squalene-hopene/tetraprenyl-beta-curcumene cyclase
MDSSHHVPLVRAVAGQAATGSLLARFPIPSAPLLDAEDPAGAAARRTVHWLLERQHADGHWVAELEGDTILESEYILLLAFLGQEGTLLARKAARYIERQQLTTGGWAIYPGGPLEISASVKAYFALKLCGYDPSQEALQRARSAILAHGGADAVNSFTRFYLALLGQISYDNCPAVPPEVLLLPRWFPVNLEAVSAWSRTILVPLSIMSARQPVTPIDPRRGIRELFLSPPGAWPYPRCPGLERGGRWWNWDAFFHATDAGLKFLARRGLMPLRPAAVERARKWMVERFEGSDGLGAIFPPMVWSIVALRSLGYADDSPEVRYCHERLQGLIIEDDDTARLQPCKSPVWDTAIALRALQDAGAADDEATRRGVAWLLDQQITRPGDWSRTVAAEPGGWCFEYANDFYPDLDDTAMAVMALAGQFTQAAPSNQPSNQPSEAAGSEPLAELDRSTAAIAKAQSWMLAMQNRDGGWGAFDRDNDRRFLCHVPFADHNAMIDPSTPDLTARVIEALGALGRRYKDKAVSRAITYLRDTQEADGSWFGRWGVNYIYGTWQVLTGLAAVGVPGDDPAVVAGANWLVAHQQPSGGWGESPDSYADPALRGQGPCTASQTAWAVLGLLAAGRRDDAATRRGIDYLIAHQRADGGWDEPEFTGTGFPRVFYLRYHYYPIYFPLLALARWRRSA